MMKQQALKAAMAVLLAVSLIGCLQSDTLIKVKSDGSGTIEETFMMKKEIVQMMQGMAGQMMGGGEAKPSKQPKAEGGFDLFDEAKLKKEAADKGEGVTYISGQKFATDQFEGYKAIYAFADINKLQYNQNPSDNMPSKPGGDAKSADEKEYITFAFTKGKPATLVVRMPEKKSDLKDASADKAPKAETPDSKESEMMMEQMKQMLGGMKIAMAIEVAGSVIKTNATHQQGSRITLMEMDFGKLLENSEKLALFNQLKPESLQDAKEIMKDLPGIKAELNKEVTIKFK